jgi:hypothetical protein
MGQRKGYADTLGGSPSGGVAAGGLPEFRLFEPAS